jgi:hypothetical protein
MPTTVVAARAAVVQVEWYGGVQVDVVAVGGRSVSEESLEVCGSEEASPLAVKKVKILLKIFRREDCLNMWFRSHESCQQCGGRKNLTNPKGDMSCFSQSVSMTKRNNIVLLKNNSMLYAKVEKTFF